jgi:hypothetical protein
MVRKPTNTASVIGSIVTKTLCSAAEVAEEGELAIWFLVVVSGKLEWRDRAPPAL